MSVTVYKYRIRFCNESGNEEVVCQTLNLLGTQHFRVEQNGSVWMVSNDGTSKRVSSDPSKTVVELCSGQMDREGTEIYEGDRLFVMDDNEIYPVKFIHGMFAVEISVKGNTTFSPLVDYLYDGVVANLNPVV